MAKVKRFGLKNAKSLYDRIIEVVKSLIEAAKTELKQLMGSGLRYKGSVATFDQLPKEGQEKGDMYNVDEAFEHKGKKYSEGTNVAWDGTDWDPLGGVTVDTSDFITESDIEAIEEYSQQELEDALK